MSRTAVRAFWGACAAGGVLIVTGWWLPAAALHLEGSIGAGDTQETFDYDRTISFAADRSLSSLALLAAGLALVVLAGVGARSLSARPLFVIAFAVASCALIHLDQSARFNSFDEDEPGVYACDAASQRDPGACAGSLLRPAIRDLAAEVRGGAVGQRAGFELLEGYRASPRIGYRVIEYSLVVVLLLAAYASIRLLVRRWWVALIAVALGTLAVLVWLFLQALSGLE